MDIWDGDNTIVGVLWLITEVAALNWALVEFLQINVVTEVAAVAGSSSGLVETVIYGVIGVAAVLALADSLGAYDMVDVVEEVLG
jgi:uncharacterized membrane protein YuzA (DUF378 family)